MKIALVGGSYQQRSIPFDAQRSINLYPVMDQEGKEVSALYGTPGITIESSYSKPGRGCFASTTGNSFAVAGDDVLFLGGGGTSYVKIGNLSTSSGNVSFAENPTQVAICDGQFIYIIDITVAPGDFAVQVVTDPDVPVAGTICFIDGYFIVNQVGTGKFFISALNNGLSWDALDFATAESSPDNLVRVINAVGQLWLEGDRTGEVWTNTGAAAFPFERISGAKMTVGILAAHSALELDNSLFWLGKDDKGTGIVYRAKGFSPQRISTEAIEAIIAQATSPSDIMAWSYQTFGHVFYILNGGGLPTTPVYDVSTGQWHERAYLNPVTAALEQHLAVQGMYVVNIGILVVSRVNGSLYLMDDNFTDDDDHPMVCERVYTHLSNENKRLTFKQLEVALESGAGRLPNAAHPIDFEPKIELSISRDMGRMWSNSYQASMGKLGEYKKRAVWRRLGTAFNWTFKVRITANTRISLIGSYLQ